ncbi:MAG: glycosyltransferase family 4 protein [Desulfobacterales bacterium]|jgi:glycosyltransferase involved in cell wall biosynthesis
MKLPEVPALGLVLKGYPRISETFISNEILLLENLGFSIHLFSMRQPRESFSHDSVKQIKAAVDYLPERLLLPLPRFLYHNILLAKDKSKNYAGALKTAWRRFLRTRKTATLKHLLQAGYLVRHLLPGHRIVHFHAHFAHSPASVAMFASQLSGIPFSFTAHAKDIYTSDPLQLREKIDAAGFVVTCTEYNRKHLSRIAGETATPIHRIYHGIDLGLFAENSKTTNPATPYRILTVARLTVKKGLPTVYRALRLLCDRGVQFQHTLVGDGAERKKILSLIKKLRLNNVARWLGTQPHHVVLDHYRQSDLFVLGCEVAPDGDRDGIPNVLLESMAIGVPVVATRVSAIPELVEHEKTGLLVPPGSPQQLAEAIVRLLKDIELRRKVAAAGRARVARIFDNQILIRNLADVYRKEIKEFRSF